jgi:Uma2 family endonuclease
MATVLDETVISRASDRSIARHVWTPVELAARFGAMPMERLRHNRDWGRATEADVVALEARTEKSLCELIDGVLVEKAMGSRESQIAVCLLTILWSFVRPNQLGLILGPDGMLRFPNGRVYLPDVTFISRDRLPNGELPDAAITPIVPDLCVEILSRSNTAAEIEAKTADYFAHGVREVWLVRPVEKTLTVLTSNGEPRVLAETDRFAAGAILPGLEFAVGELFAAR